MIFGDTHVHLRAPTDESARLLKDLEESALKRVLAQGVLEKNHLHVRWVIISGAYVAAGENPKLHFKFDLNGHTHSGEFEITAAARYNPASFRQKLVEAVSKEVLSVVLHEFTKQIDPQNLSRAIKNAE